MGFFSNFWNVFTKPVVQVVQQTSNVVSHVLDTTTNVTDAVTTTTAKALSGVPIIGTIAAHTADEFNFQVNNAVNLIDDQQATVGSLLDLGQYIVGDALDPSVNNIPAAVDQGNIYINSTYIDGTISTIQNGLNSLFDFG